MNYIVLKGTFVLFFERSCHMKDNKSQLLELIDSLSDNQIIFVLSMLKELYSDSYKQDIPSV